MLKFALKWKIEYIRFRSSMILSCFSRFLTLLSHLMKDIIAHLEYCAIKMQNFVYNVYIVLFVLFCVFYARQVIFLKAFCSVPIKKAALEGEVKKYRIGWRTNSILRGHHE